MEVLLAVIRGEACIVSDAEWSAMLALAEEHRVAAWVAHRLRQGDVLLTGQRKVDLQQIERQSTIAAFFWSCELKDLLRRFFQRGVPVVPLKGPLLAETLYGASSLRTCRDLDLLVSRADHGRAEQVLIDANFAPGEPDDYHRPWSRRSAVVELHRDVENPLAFDFGVDAALRRASATSFEGEACRQLASEDELLYLCLHAARHRYERLSLVLDLRLAFEKLTPSASWTPRPEARQMDGLVVLGLAMVRRFDPDFTPDISIDVPAAYRSHLERVADALWHKLTHQTAPPLDWRAIHAFFVQIEQPGWPRLRRRWRHLRILSSRVIEADAKFAAKMGLHARWQARLLRPLRIISERLARSSANSS